MPRAMSNVKGTPSSEKITRSVPAPGTSLAVTSAHAPHRLAVDEHRHGPTRSPAGSGPSSSSGASTRRRTPLAVAHA